MKFLKRILLSSLLLASVNSTNAQTAFDSTLVFNQVNKLNSLYSELMDNASFVKVFDKKQKIKHPIPSPWKHRGGEATFVYEVSDSDSLINIYMTELWWYSKFDDEINVKDYIVYVDENGFGFDYDRVKQHKISPQSREIIDYLFGYVKENMSFEVIKPRERNLKYSRIRFE